MSELGEGSSVSKPEDPEKYLKVKVLEVDFSDSFDVVNNKKKVVSPHWPCGKYNFNYSEKPAVMKFGQPSKATVKVKVDSKGISGNGVLRGVFKGYVIEGELPLSSGDKTITVKFISPPDKLEYIKGSILWEAEGGGFMDTAGTTFAELFFVFDNPCKYDFFKKGVWAEALRYAFEGSLLKGKDIEKEAVVEVTNLCFNVKYHQYDIFEGKTHFGGLSGKFKLSQYIKPSSSLVNCHDQAYAVVVFSGALGVKTEGLFMQPFGFLNKTQLVGRGPCNNPFPKRKFDSEIKRLKSSVVGLKKMALSKPKLEDFLLVARDDPDRSAFGNHSYCEHVNSIFDACAGPNIGTGDRNAYVTNNIDSKTKLNSLYGGLPGIVADIKSHTSIGASVNKVE